MSEYTKNIKNIIKELNVSFSVALDIDLLRSYERRIISCYKKLPGKSDCSVENEVLEKELKAVENG